MIKVNDLHFTYKKASGEVLKGINVEIKEGEVFGFLGPSGAGKSTLQKILLGLYKNYQGSVKVMGQEVKKVKKSYYNKVGVGFELPNLYEQLTIMENMKTFASLYDEPMDIETLLKEVGLYEDRNKKVCDISKGMKMRLNFCRAQVGNPSILFLDEPTSGLDPNNTKVIQDKIMAYKKKGYTVILTTHNMTFAEDRNKYGSCEVQVVTTKGRCKFPLEHLKDNMAFMESLKEEIISIDTLKPTLQEIFTIVTGRVLV